MTLFFKKHAGASIIVIVVSLLYFLPNLLGASGGDIPLNLEEVFSYGVKVREVMDGHFADGDPYLAEYKNKFMTWDYYPLSVPLGLVALILRLDSPEQLFVWLDLLLPPIIFLIMYFLFFEISKSKSWSALASFMFTAFPNILAYKRIFSTGDVIAWLGSGFNPDLSRLFVPALTLILFSIFLLVFLKLYKDESMKRQQIIFAGISYGLLFYVYFYYWVFATIALMLGVVILRLVRDGRKAREIVQAFGIGIAVSIPHWFRYIILIKNPNFKEYVSRVGIEYAHALRWESLDFVFLVIVLVIALWYLRKLIGIKTVVFLTSLLLATIVVLNLQVILGFTPQPDHWTSRVNLYIFILSLMTVLFFVTRTFSLVRWSKVVLATIIMLSFNAQLQKVGESKYDFSPSPELRAAYQWINQHIPSDAVLVTPSVRSRMLLPYFTHANVYLPMACLSLAPQKEIIRRYLEVYRAFKVPEELVLHSLVDFHDTSSAYDEAIYLEEIETNFAVFCDKFNPVYRRGRPSEKDTRYRGAPEELVAKFMTDYESQPVVDFRDLKSQADYVFWGPGEKLISKINPSEIKELELVYSDNLTKIFKVKKDG